MGLRWVEYFQENPSKPMSDASNKAMIKLLLQALYLTACFMISSAQVSAQETKVVEIKFPSKAVPSQFVLVVPDIDGNGSPEIVGIFSEENSLDKFFIYAKDLVTEETIFSVPLPDGHPRGLLYLGTSGEELESQFIFILDSRIISVTHKPSLRTIHIAWEKALPFLLDSHSMVELEKLHDLDRDGHADFSVGVTNARLIDKNTRIGFVEIFSGSSGEQIAGTNNVVNTYFGSSVKSIPDIDNDNIPDIIISGSNPNYPTGELFYFKSSDRIFWPFRSWGPGEGQYIAWDPRTQNILLASSAEGVIRSVPIDSLVSAAAGEENIGDNSRIVFRGEVVQLAPLLWNTDGFLDFLIGKQIIESSPDTFSISSRAIGRVVDFIPNVLADRFLSNPLVPGLIVLIKNTSYYAALSPSFGNIEGKEETKHINDEKHLFLSDAQIVAHLKNEWARTDLSKKWVLESSSASIPLGFSVTCNDEVADIVLKGRRSNKFLIVSIANERSLEQVFLSAVKLQKFFETKLNTSGIKILVLTTSRILDIPDWFRRQRDFDIEKIHIAIESEKIK